jgi:hypothetical protein
VRCFLSISSELSSHHFCFLHLHGLRNRISLINSFRDSFHGYRVGFWEHKKCSVFIKDVPSFQRRPQAVFGRAITARPLAKFKIRISWASCMLAWYRNSAF